MSLTCLGKTRVCIYRIENIVKFVKRRVVYRVAKVMKIKETFGSDVIFLRHHTLDQISSARVLEAQH